MNDNKFSPENLSGKADDSKKEDFADISFKKTDAVSRNKSEKKPLDNAEASEMSKDADEKKETDKSSAVIASHKPKTSEKAVPDLNLKGIKVDLSDVKSEIKAEPEMKKPVEKQVSKPVNKAVQKPAEKPEKKQAEKKPSVKPEVNKKADSTDGQKTMVMKDPSSVNISDSKAYIKSDVKSNQSKKKNQSSFNNSIFGGFFLAFGIVVAAFIVAIGGISLGKEYLGIDKAENDITFNIPQGSTSADIAEMLEENQII